MRRMRLLLLASVLLLACKNDVPVSPQKETRAAAVENDVQTVSVVVSDMGYAPGTIELKAGIPARITFEQQSRSHCASQVQIPSFNVPKTDLPFGQKTVVEFTPKESGSFTFTCGMDMLKGTILVKS